MLICSIDTSGREGSLALVRYEADFASGLPVHDDKLVLLQLVPLAGGQYSADLLPALVRTLGDQQLKKTDIDLFTVVSGPGSFTGLRVGLATVKGLADALNKPIVPITVLEAVAVATGRQGRVLTALDAQRNEVFVGEFELSPEAISYPAKLLHEGLAPIEDFASWLKSRNPAPATFTPDVSIETRVRESGSSVELVSRPAADFYAKVGFMKFAAGERASVETLDANYIRRSDAEIFSPPKLGIRT